MSQSLNLPACCPATTCTDPIVENIPGPIGPAGEDGADGDDGINAFTSTTQNFTQPAVGANVSAAVLDSSWAAIGQDVFIESGGYYLVISKPGPTSLTVRNLGYTANAAPGAVIPMASRVSASGEKGAAGTNGTSATVPLTTKGDVLGYDSAAARIAVGTDGKVLAADAAQALGLNYVTVLPNVATDNAVPRFDGAAGLPVPLQNSKLIVTDDGAAQASGSGGNARGTRAVDLQTVRADAAEVASGLESVIGGGNSNKASATNATVAGGNANAATAINTTIAGGELNAATGIYSQISGGSNNISGGPYSAIIGGNSCVTDLYGQVSHSSGSYDPIAVAQTSELLWRNTTTNATPTELFLDGASLKAVMRDAFSWAFIITILGRNDTTSDTAAWQVTGAIKMSGASPSLVSAVNAALLAADAGSIAAGWGVIGAVAVTADVANDSLKIAVTGAAATSLRWLAHARLVEVYWPD